jgi:inosine/xanthosine triphosphate pyrophosphatase family protein
MLIPINTLYLSFFVCYPIKERYTMKTYKLVKFLSTYKAILEQNGNTYVASFADVPYSGPEVLVFPATAEGSITDWSEVDGGRGYSSLQDFLSQELVNTN